MDSARRSRTEAGSAGAGAGLTLGLLLERLGIGSIVLEQRSRSDVGGRVRAGPPEQSMVDLMGELGVDANLRRQGLVHDGIGLRWQGRTGHVPMTQLTGRSITIYGQQHDVADLIAACLERGFEVRFEVEDVAVQLHRLGDGDPSRPACSWPASSRSAAPGRRLPTWPRTTPACRPATTSRTGKAG
jgi:p-hydroxybenzoate 3-monooxygenase